MIIRLRYFFILCFVLYLGPGLGTMELAAQTLASSNIRAGREKISLELPHEYNWQSQKIPKDEASIRSWAHQGSLKQPTLSLSFVKLMVNTIDRRYYPIRAGAAVAEKLTLSQNADPMSRLEIIQQKSEENLTVIIFSIHPGGSESPQEFSDAAESQAIELDSDPAFWPPGSYVMLGLAANGPTAYHEIELRIPKVLASPELIQYWAKILSASKIH